MCGKGVVVGFSPKDVYLAKKMQVVAKLAWWLYPI